MEGCDKEGSCHIVGEDEWYSMRLLDLELFGDLYILCVLMASRMKLCVFTDHLSTKMYYARYVIELLAMKVTRRDTNVWMKGENQLRQQVANR